MLENPYPTELVNQRESDLTMRLAGSRARMEHAERLLARSDTRIASSLLRLKEAEARLVSSDKQLRQPLG